MLQNIECPFKRFKDDVVTFKTERPTDGLEFYFDLVLLHLKYLSLSYILNYSDPKSRWVVDLICVAQLLALVLVVLSPPNALGVFVANYILGDIYLNLINIVFIKVKEINPGPKSVERSVLLLLLNVIDLVVAFGVFYRYWLGICTSDAVYGAILVFGTIGTPKDLPKMPVAGRILVAVQVFLALFLISVVIGSVIGRLNDRADEKPSR